MLASKQWEALTLALVLNSVLPMNPLILGVTRVFATVKVSLLATAFLGAVVLVTSSMPRPRYELNQSVAPTATVDDSPRSRNPSVQHTGLFRSGARSSVAFNNDASSAAAPLAGLHGTPQYQVLHHFVQPPTYPLGGLIQGSDGDFYGTTANGGDADGGTVFKLDEASGNPTVLHSFIGYDGAGPWAPLIQANDGTYYGTTVAGLGSAALGTVFKMDASGAMQTIHLFTGTDGYFPQAELIQASDGNFYGTTVYGGLNDKGTVFKMDAQGNVTTLHSFWGGDGEFPSSKLVQANDGTFYGMTDYGGTFGLGTVFKMHPTTGVVTSLYSFEQTTGNTATGGLRQGSDGSFYGTTVFGGASGKGTIFKIDAAGILTLLHTFTQSDGSQPGGGFLLGSDGNFYGTTASGGTGAAGSAGTAFKMSASGIVTTLHSFSGSDGRAPSARFIEAPDGNFYSTTFTGGPWNRGTAFRMSALGVVTTLTVFPATDGASPSAGLLQATDGNFYGTTEGGGAKAQGTVFKMDASGVVTLLHSFAEATGFTYPSAELIEGSNGNLYGTTLFGGDALAGTVFKMDSSGAMTTLHRFAGSDGAYPYAGLLQGNDGNSYGTTYSGGANNKGVVFKISGRSGAVTTLHSFAGGREGANPQSALIQAGLGDLYGTTPYGGRSNQGTVFKMNPRSGAVTTLYSFTRFSGFDGKNPQAALILHGDGNLYGTTDYGGAYDKGTIFRIRLASGVMTTLHSFAGTDGATPRAKLVSGADGNLYGTTYEGGANDKGTVFMVSASGAVTTIHSFMGSDGGHPDSRLIRGNDGYLYGTTLAGGSSDIGVIFRLPIADASQSIPTGLSVSANRREPPPRTAQYQRSFFPIGQRQQQDRKR